MEKNKKSTEDIKRFFQYTGKLSSDYISGIKALNILFILITLGLSAESFNEIKSELSIMIVTLYMSAFMVCSYIRQYIFAGAYESGSISAKVQSIYDVIRYAPFDISVMRKELLRRTSFFLLKLTAAGGVIQLIKFAAAPKEYRPEDLVFTAVLLFIWPFVFGTVYILQNERSAAGQRMLKTKR